MLAAKTGANAREQPHDVLEPGDRRRPSRRLAAAIGVDGDVRREQRAQALHVAVAGRGEERFRDLASRVPSARDSVGGLPEHAHGRDLPAGGTRPDLAPIVAATSSKSRPNTSCSRKAARSNGDRRSSAISSGKVTSSELVLA